MLKLQLEQIRMKQTETNDFEKTSFGLVAGLVFPTAATGLWNITGSWFPHQGQWLMPKFCEIPLPNTSSHALCHYSIGP